MDHAAFGRVLEKIVKLLGDGAVDRVVKFEAVPFRELAAVLCAAAEAVGRYRDDGNPAIRLFEARV